MSMRRSKPLSLLMATGEFIALRLIVQLAVLYPGYEIVMWAYRIGRDYGHSRLYLSDALYMFLGLCLAYFITNWPRKLLLHLVSSLHVAAIVLVMEGRTSKVFSTSFKMIFKRFGATLLLFTVDLFLRKSAKEVSLWLVDKTENLPKIFKQGILSRLMKSSLEKIIFNCTECILGYLVLNPEKDIWEGSVHGIGVYFKSWKTVIKSALFTSIKLKIAGIMVRLTVIGISIYILEKNFLVLVGLYVVLKVIGVLVDSCIIQPYILVSMMLAIDFDQEVDDDLFDRLADLSDTFASTIHRSREEGNRVSEQLSERVRDLLPEDGLPNLPASRRRRSRPTEETPPSAD